MTTRTYTRREIAVLLELDEPFVAALERERVIEMDAPDDARGGYSERMLERVRVAHQLVDELEVNLAGAAVIVRMREELIGARRDLRALLLELRRRGGR
ncbi:MAG: chaperone modulator CbpM [Myxococcota bacterium]